MKNANKSIKTNSITVTAGAKKSIKNTFLCTASKLTILLVRTWKYKAEKSVFVLSIEPNEQLKTKLQENGRNIMLPPHYFICLFKHFQIK